MWYYGLWERCLTVKFCLYLRFRSDLILNVETEGSTRNVGILLQDYSQLETPQYENGFYLLWHEN